MGWRSPCLPATGLDFSLPNSFALSLAKTNGFVLLTGNKALPQLAGKEQVACHGVLWVLEEMHAGTMRHPRDLHTGLSSIANHPRCRLPRRDITNVLGKFAAAFED